MAGGRKENPKDFKRYFWGDAFNGQVKKGQNQLVQTRSKAPVVKTRGKVKCIVITSCM